MVLNINPFKVVSSQNAFFIFIIGCFIFLILYWLLHKLIASRILMISFASILSISLTPILYKLTVIALFTGLFYEYHPERNFSEESWKENVINRHEMRNDILAKDRFLGKTKEEITVILGRPNSCYVTNKNSMEIWRFDMGRKGHGLGWKFYSLVLKFEKSKVLEVESEEIID